MSKIDTPEKVPEIVEVSPGNFVVIIGNREHGYFTSYAGAVEYIRVLKEDVIVEGGSSG